MMWDRPVRLFDGAFSVFFDTARSTPRQLVAAGEPAVRARIEPSATSVNAAIGDVIHVPVRVTNLSRIALTHGSSPFGLSYHLMTADRQLLRFDHARHWFTDPLPPGASRTVNVSVDVPDTPGTYELEFDIVWESVSWMKDLGNPTAVVQLTATAGVAADSVPEPATSRSA